MTYEAFKMAQRMAERDMENSGMAQALRDQAQREADRILAPFRAVIEQIAFPGFQFRIDMDGARPFVQVRCKEGVCNVTGEPLEWGGRKWFLSPHMTTSEVVNTVFKAVMTAIEHETREKFTYKGETIYDPHLDVDMLVEFRRNHALSGRAPITA